MVNQCVKELFKLDLKHDLSMIEEIAECLLES